MIPTLWSKTLFFWRFLYRNGTLAWNGSKKFDPGKFLDTVVGWVIIEYTTELSFEDSDLWCAFVAPKFSKLKKPKICFDSSRLIKHHGFSFMQV